MTMFSFLKVFILKVKINLQYQHVHGNEAAKKIIGVQQLLKLARNVDKHWFEIILRGDKVTLVKYKLVDKDKKNNFKTIPTVFVPLRNQKTISKSKSALTHCPLLSQPQQKQKRCNARAQKIAYFRMRLVIFSASKRTRDTDNKG